MDLEELGKNNYQMSVSSESIEYMKQVVKKNKLKKVLEIGTFIGYSAIHFSSVAEKVVSVDIDKKSIEIAKQNFKKFNSKNIEVIEGDAKEILANLNEKFDLIFIDAMKREYKNYLILSLKLIKKGFIYADNTISHKEHMKEFFEYLDKGKLNWKELGIGSGLVEIKI